MKLLSYLLKKFFIVFFGSLFFFVLILCLTDLLINIWSYISKGVPVAVVGRITFYYVPKTIWYAVPIATLFSVAYVLSDLYARNELMAVFASGVSLLRFTSPLLVLSVVMSFGLFYFEDNFVVESYAKKMSLQQQVLNRNQSLNRENIVVMTDQGSCVYKADFYDAELKRLYALYVVFRTPDRSFDSLIYADSAVWQEDHWVLSGATEYTLAEDGMMMQRPAASEWEDKLTESPETFQNNTLSVEEITTSNARTHISHLEHSGLPTAEARSQYYKKFAFPCVVFIVVFLAIGLSGKTRKNVLIVSLALSIGAVVLFYITQMITMALAKFELIPPVMGAWFPVVMFIILSFILLRFTRT
jgi:lipopolysaccharide export system permease protein